MKSYLKYFFPVLGVFISFFLLAYSSVFCYAADLDPVSSVNYRVSMYNSEYGDTISGSISYDFSGFNTDICCLKIDDGIYFLVYIGTNIVDISDYITTDIGSFGYSRLYPINSSDFVTVGSATFGNGVSSWESLGYSVSSSYVNGVRIFGSISDCYNYLTTGDSSGEIEIGSTIVDSSDVPVPQGDLYLNSSVIGDGQNKYYQGIKLTNYDPDYTVVYRTRYTIPTYVTVNATSVASANVNVLSYYTSGISLDTCSFNSSSEAYFVFFNRLGYEYERKYWTEGGAYDLTDDVSLAFYRQDGSLSSAPLAVSEFYGDYDTIVADSSPCVRNVSSPFVGKEIWIAYQVTDSSGVTYISEYQKFIVYPLSTATYNRLLTRYFWDASNIDSGVVYDSTSVDDVGNDSIYESSALISNATGDTNLSGTESGSGSLDVNVNDVTDAMTSLTSLMGSVPTWFSYIFGFLPSWLITLISIGIAWAVVVGMIKLLKW